jgi:hypothetical protein
MNVVISYYNLFKMVNIKQIALAAKNYKLKSIVRTAYSQIISDAVIISFRKTGKTWLRLLYAKTLQEEFGIQNIKLDTQFMTVGKKLPNVMFSHAGTTKVNNKIDFIKLFSKKKIIFLARDPRSVVTSRFNDFTKRTKIYSGSLSEFVRDRKQGIEVIINDFNYWAPIIKEKAHLVRYEDLMIDTHQEFLAVLNFLNIKVSDEAIQKAINYTQPGNMRKMERENSFNDIRMQAGDHSDLNSYKVRQCKVDSYKDEMNQEDLEFCTKLIKEKLDPVFRY